ncbi:MAG: hypothetical protein K0R19_2153 [Bacillota bacterium]|nr:hypothetical protein [Bacillota bacterium]
MLCLFKWCAMRDLHSCMQACSCRPAPAVQAWTISGKTIADGYLPLDALSGSSPSLGFAIKKALLLLCLFKWCAMRDLNPHGRPLDPKSSASANSANRAYFFVSTPTVPLWIGDVTSLIVLDLTSSCQQFFGFNSFSIIILYFFPFYRAFTNIISEIMRLADMRCISLEFVSILHFLS